MQKHHSFTNDHLNHNNGVDMQQQQQQTSQNGPGGQMPWASGGGMAYQEPGGGYLQQQQQQQSYEAQYNHQLMQQQQQQRWANEQQMKMNSQAMAAAAAQQQQQYQIQQQQQQNQLTTAMRHQKHLAPRPAPYAPSRQAHQQQQQQHDMRHLAKPTKSSDSLGMPAMSPGGGGGGGGYPPAAMMPSPVGGMGGHESMSPMMMPSPNGGMTPGVGQYPVNTNYRYYPPQGQQPQPPYHVQQQQQQQQQQYPGVGHLQQQAPPPPPPAGLTKQPSQLSLRVNEASSTPPPPQASSLPLPPRPQSSSVVVVENGHGAGLSHSTSLQSLHEHDNGNGANGNGAQMNPTPPITPKLNNTPSDMVGHHQSTLVPAMDGIRLTLPIHNGELVPPFKIPHGQMYFTITFEISSNSLQSLNGRSDFDVHLKACRLPPHIEQTQQPERVVLEEAKNLPCQWPPNVVVHVNQVFVRSIAQDPSVYNQPISLKRWTRQGQNCVQFQVTNADCICSYHFYVEYVHRPSIKMIMEESMKKFLVPLDKSASSLKSWIRQMAASDPTKTPGYVLNLNDPLNPDRLLIYPVRGRDVCQHPDCFDLESFLLFNYKNEGTMRRSDRWKCPICMKFIAKDFEADEFIQCMIGEVSTRVNTQYFASKQLQLANPNCNYVDEIAFDADLRPKFRRSQFSIYSAANKPMMPGGGAYQAPAMAPQQQFNHQQQQQQLHYQMMMAANENSHKKQQHHHLSDMSPNVKSPSPAALQPPPSASPSFNPVAAGPYYFNNMNTGAGAGQQQMIPNLPPMKPMTMAPKQQQPMYPQQQYMPHQYQQQVDGHSVIPRPPSASAQPNGQQHQYYANQMNRMGPVHAAQQQPGKQLPMYSPQQFSNVGPQQQQQQFSPLGYSPHQQQQAQQHSSELFNNNGGQNPRPPSASANTSFSAVEQQHQQQQTKIGTGNNQGLPPNSTNPNSHLEHLQFASSPISNPSTPASTISTSLSSNNMLGHLTNEQQQQQQQYQFQQQQAAAAFNQQQQQMMKNSMSNHQHQPLTPQSQAQSIYSNASVSQPSTPSPSTPKHMNNNSGSYDNQNNQTLMQQQQSNSNEKTSSSVKSPGHVIDLTNEQQQQSSDASLKEQDQKDPAPSNNSEQQRSSNSGGEEEQESPDSSSSLENSTSNYENGGDSQLTDEEKDILTEALTISEIQAGTGGGESATDLASTASSSSSSESSTTGTCLETTTTTTTTTTATATTSAAAAAAADNLDHPAPAADQPFLDPSDLEQLLLDLRSAGEGPSVVDDLKLDAISETAGFDELLVYLSSGEVANRSIGDEAATSNIAEIQTGLLKGFSVENSAAAVATSTEIQVTNNSYYQHSSHYQQHHHVQLTTISHHHQQPNSS